MSELVLIPAAFLAGLLMFLAPCTLPIVPGYLAFIGGGEGRVVRNAIFFVIGFSVVFILLGLFAGFVGSLLGPWHDYLPRVAGLVIILFGLTMLGLFRIPVLSGERHIALPKFLTVGSSQSSFFIGALFALGWSPCIGPILGTILLFASTSATVWQGALLLFVFSLGLGLPFIAVALLMERAGTLIARSARALDILSKVGGVVLILVGTLMFAGDMALLVSWALGFFDALYRPLLPYM